jgi:mannan endo-1,4-beta-mannosidase
VQQGNEPVKPLHFIFCSIFGIGIILQAQQPDAAPVNPNATPAARALLQEIDSVSGKATLTGEHNFPNTVSRYSDRVYELTGHYPAIFGQDFGFSTGEDKDSTLGRPSMIREVIRQYRAGSVIALCWHAVRPTEDEPVTFRDSVQGKLTDWEFQQVLTPGTDLHARWERQVDRIAGYLRELEDAGVPVLFRPYHEMNGNWFWWGGRPGPDGTAALYRMIFDRYVHVHHLNNLIWVWNVNAPSVNAGPVDQYWPGPDYADVVAMDIYGAFEQNDYDSMLALAGDHKPVALAEVGTMPTLEVLAGQPRWAYMMMWSGSAEGANSAAQLQAIFHAPNLVDRNDPRLPLPLPAPAGPLAPQDLTATAATRAMLAKFSVATDAMQSPGASQRPQSPQIVEIDMKNTSAHDITERVRRATKAGELPLLRWTPLSPTGKGGVPLDDFEWSELRRQGTLLNLRWQGEIDEFARLLEQLQKEETPVLLSAMPEPNSEADWWGARPGPEGSQALLRDIHQSFATHHLNNIVWIWEPTMGAPGRDPTQRGAPVDEFYPGPLFADLILLNQANPGEDQGRGVRVMRQLSGPKPLGIRTSSTDASATDRFDFVVAPAATMPIDNEASP